MTRSEAKEIMEFLKCFLEETEKLLEEKIPPFEAPYTVTEDKED